MSIATHGLKLERHRHGATVADLTPYTLQVREIHGRMPPFGGLDVDLDVPAAEWALLPAPGDWLVLRDARTNVALQVANVAPVEPGLNVAGARVETKVTQVSADTWFDYLERLNVYMVDRATVGTLFSDEDYSQIIAEAGALGTNGKIGAVLARVLERLTNVLLPASLTGQTLGAGVRVVFDAETAERYARGRVVEPIKGTNVRGLDTGGLKGDWTGVSVLDLLLGTFWQARQMVELFPSIEPQRRGAHVAWVPHGSGLRLGSAVGAAPSGGSAWEEAADRGGDMALGANLTLVYRIVPWRVRPLRDVVHVVGGGENRGLDPAFDQNKFGGVTWHPESARVVTADEIVSIGNPVADSNRINAVTADMGASETHHYTLAAEAGLPIWDAESVRQHGLRLYNPSWPFDSAVGTRMSVNAVVRTVAAQAAQFMFGAERFMSGSATLNHLRRDIRQGEIVRFDLHRTKVLTAYVDRVQHVVTASAAIEGTTTVFFSRGLFDERLRDVQVSIDLPVVAPEQGTSQQSSPGSAILFNGQLLPIAWANVRLFDRADSLALTAGFTTSRRSMAAIDMGVLHWDATLKARKTRKVLADRGLSTHFVIDWDGTIYQLVDLAYPAWHAGTTAVNNRSVGVDLNTPVRTGASTEVALAQLNARLFLGGQPVRPIVTGWKVNAQEIAPFLGFHDVQLDAFRALAAALKTHFGVPLVSPAYAGSQTLVTVPSLNGLAPGWYHHAEVSSEALHGADGTPLPIKEDTCGVELPDVLAQAGPFPATPSPSP